jgi:tetratricopeptide (TPR) repeat protein
MKNLARVAALAVAAASLGCASARDVSSVLTPGVQAISLLGDTLVPLELPPPVLAQREADLAAARQAYEADPNNADATIWYGRRLAYLGLYREAIDVYTRGLAKHPDDARLYRHRGHRYITVREFENAVHDLSRAAKLIEGRVDEVEPDGQPNARGIPTSTLQSNIWYHLGLAHYLRGDFERALQAYEECLKVSNNPDMLVATSHWLYMTLRRLERTREAADVLLPITPNLEIIENDAYYRLLLMYQGALDAETLLDSSRQEGALQNATVGYGIGNWHLYHGRRAKALEMFRMVLATPEWAAFGYIAAEADVARSAPIDSDLR